MLASTMSGTLGSMAVARAESGSARPGTPSISTSASHSSTCRDLRAEALQSSSVKILPGHSLLNSTKSRTCHDRLFMTFLVMCLQAGCHSLLGTL